MAKTSARPKQELDRATRARLEALMGQVPETLTAGDRAFLKARREYLTADERADYLDGVEDEAEVNRVDQYDVMNREDLKEALKERGLPVGGKVDELRDRLRESNASVPETTE